MTPYTPILTSASNYTFFIHPNNQEKIPDGNLFLDCKENITGILNESVLELTPGSIPLPLPFREMSPNSRNCVLAYTCLFVLAVFLNLSVFYSVVRQIFRFKVKTRITLLILHLSIADLFVTFFLIPMEVAWRISIQWYGGNALCKVCQFLRPFGLYLSSMVIVAISLDRYLAINHPLRVDGKKMVKVMLGAAWVVSLISSLPQTFIFSVRVHPVYTSFKNCVSIGYFETPEEEILYNVFSILVMYFAPLVVILISYALILRKITQKSKEQKQLRESVTESLASRRDALREDHKNTDVVDANKFATNGSLMTSKPKTEAQVSKNRNWIGKDMKGTRVEERLRWSDNGGSTIRRARNRTLRLTIIIVLVFIFCSTPYVLMVLWYMFDREGAKKVDERVQDILFMMAVASSVANPLIYGSFTKGCSVLCGLQSIPMYFRRRSEVSSNKSRSTWVTGTHPINNNLS